MIYVCIFVPLGAVIIAAGMCLYFNNVISVTRFKHRIEGAERPFKIVHLSDLHGKSFGKGNRRLIKKVKELSPDIICFTGDIIHNYSGRNKSTALSAVSALAEVAPVLYVSGNHEMRNKGYADFRESLKKAGATILDNAVTVYFGVNFVGLNGACNKNDTIFKITPQGDNKILLAHMPHHFPRYASAGYPLVLCGHAHGGQWRLPFTNIGIYAPGQGLFPRYVGGEYTLGGSTMILSRGLGNSKFPIRLFNNPQIICIDIT